MDELSAALHHYLTTASGSNFSGRDVTILAQWEGDDNLLWHVAADGEEATVKYYLDAGQARGRRQYDGHERYYRLGIAPQPLWFDRYPTGLSRQLLVYRWMAGEQVDGAEPTQLVQMAQATAQIHGDDPTTVRRFSPHPINLDYLWKVLQGGLPTLDRWLAARKATEVARLVHGILDRAQPLVAAALPLWQGVAPTPIHGDLKLSNALVAFGMVVLLDWELFGLGDAAHDVARFLVLNRNHLSAKAQAAWLEHYLSAFEQPLLAQRIALYERIIPLQHLLYLLHGLQQNYAEDAVLLRENQGFLSATLVAAFEQSAIALDYDQAIRGDAFRALF